MARSTITSKYQTTVPREAREKLGVGPGDVLRWEVAGEGAIRVMAADTAFLRRRGSIRIGPGSTVEDVERAGSSRGSEKPREIPLAKLFEDPGMIPARDMDQALARDWPDDIDRDRG